MEYTRLGHTGLDVSRICLGCMSYGGGNQSNHDRSLGEEESRPFTGAFRTAIAAGPLLTSVSPAHDGAWRQFANREFAVLPADPAAIDLWRRCVQMPVMQLDRRNE